MATNLSTANGQFQRFGWFFTPRYWWLRHLLFWLFYYFEFLLAAVGVFSPYESTAWDIIRVEVLPDVLLVYVLLLVLIPYLLLRNRLLEYLGAVALVVVAHAIFAYNDPTSSAYDDGQINAFTVFYEVYLLSGIQLAIQVTGLRYIVEFINYQLLTAKEAESRLQTELAYLKSQVSPHFLFNTLNGISVLSEKYPDRIAPVVRQLSGVLRYQLYEGDKPTVLLKKEIEHLNNYLELERIRQSNADIKMEVKGDLGYVSVAPMLFLPFVENAVKHGRDARGNTQLRIVFERTPTAVSFTCDNYKPPRPVQHETGGIGLKNIRRRLALLYPDAHTLDIRETADRYHVALTLQIPPDA